MNIENLTQYDRDKFKELFGIHMQEVRTAMKWTTSEFAAHLRLPENEIVAIESGKKTLSQDAFDYLRESLNLDENEILNMSRITQAQMLMEIHREINEHYPK